MTWWDWEEAPPAGRKGMRGGWLEFWLRRTGADRFARSSCALVVVGMVRVELFEVDAPLSYTGVSRVRLAMEGRGLGIREVVGLSVKVMVVAGRAACGAVVLVAVFLTTMFLLRVSFCRSRISPLPKSKPSSKSSSWITGFDLGDGALGLIGVGLLNGEGDDGAAMGDRGGSWMGTDVAGVGAVGVRDSSRNGRGGRSEGSWAGGCWVLLSFSRRAPKSMGSVGSTRPPKSSSSLSMVMILPRLGLMADTDELRAPRLPCRVPANRMPREPSPQSKSSSSSAGVRGLGAFSFSPSFALLGSSRSLPQSSSTSIFLVDFFLPSLLIDPPSRAEEGTLVGMGMPACFAAVLIADVFVAWSSGVMRNCQSSWDSVSERTLMREESEWTVEFLKRRPSERSSKSPSSHVSIWVDWEVMEAMRAAKERLLAAMLGGARISQQVRCGVRVGVQDLRERY
jgi:hypothetical protein